MYFTSQRAGRPVGHSALILSILKSTVLTVPHYTVSVGTFIPFLSFPFPYINSTDYSF